MPKLEGGDRFLNMILGLVILFGAGYFGYRDIDQQRDIASMKLQADTVKVLAVLKAEYDMHIDTQHDENKLEELDDRVRNIELVLASLVKE